MLTNQKLKDIIYQKYVKEQLSYNEVIQTVKQELYLEITKTQLKYIIQQHKWQRKQNVNGFSKDEQKKILALYNQHKTAMEISKMLNIENYKKVHAFLRRNGFYTPRSVDFKLSGDDINKICVMYQNGLSASKILEEYSHLIKSEKTILKIIKDKGITVRPRGWHTNIKNEDFFENIQSEDQAYILGWLISDGYIIYPKKKTPFWGLTLQSNDRYILEYIKDTIGVNKKIVDTIRKRTETTTCESELTVVSQKMVQDLSKYGIIPQKSKKIHLPLNIPKSLMPHLIRGIFDGDGCICKNKITFYGNQYMMSEIQDFLNEELNIPKRTISFTQSCYSFSFSKEEEVKKFYDYLYSDAHTYLKRKKERFHELSYIK